MSTETAAAGSPAAHSAVAPARPQTAAQGNWAHTPQAQEQRRRKAKALARLCYARGIDARILDAAPLVRRRLARTAEVNPPHEPSTGEAGETWHQVVELLDQRAQWDRRYDRTPPPAARCLLCASTTPGPAPSPAWATCTHACSVCNSLLHPTLTAHGHTTHPTCEPQAGRPPASTAAGRSGTPGGADELVVDSAADDGQMQLY